MNNTKEQNSPVWQRPKPMFLHQRLFEFVIWMGLSLEAIFYRHDLTLAIPSLAACYYCLIV